MAGIVEVYGVSKVYGKGAAQVVALQGVDLALRGGDFVALMGPSGSGKSTLLHLVGCLDQPSGGKICIAGEQVSSIRPANLWRVRNQRIGFVFQSNQLIPTLTALENVMLPLKYAGTIRDEAEEKARDKLGVLGLAKRLSHFPHQLSGGEQARVALARALINEPDVILADEPTGELDSKTSQQVMGLLRECSASHNAIMIVTHDQAVADQCQQIYQMHDGQILS